MKNCKERLSLVGTKCHLMEMNRICLGDFRALFHKVFLICSSPTNFIQLCHCLHRYSHRFSQFVRRRFSSVPVQLLQREFSHDIILETFHIDQWRAFTSLSLRLVRHLGSFVNSMLIGQSVSQSQALLCFYGKELWEGCYFDKMT